MAQSQDAVDLDREDVVDIYDETGEPVEIDLNQLFSSTENVALRFLTELRAKPRSWLLIAGEYVRVGRANMAEELLSYAIENNFADHSAANPSGIVDALAMQGYLALVEARTAPRVILAEAKHDKLELGAQSSMIYFKRASDCFQRADQVMETLARTQPGMMRRGRLSLWMGKALLALSTRDFREAEALLALCTKYQPNNLLVLMLSGRTYLQTRRVDQALRAYQRVLALCPNFGVPNSSPSGRRDGMDNIMKSAMDEGVGMDPRVGLGLCFWLLGDIRKGRMAWNRAIALNPRNKGARLLLGLVDFNESKNPGDHSHKDKQISAAKVFGQLFSESKGQIVPAALGIVRNAEIQGQMSRAIKLTERAIQYADTAAHSRRAVSERCRLAFLEGDENGVEIYSSKLRGDPFPDVVVEIIRAQVLIKNGTAFYREALNVIDVAASKLEKNAPQELRVLHALLLAFPHPGMSAAELTANVKRSRDILTRLHETYKAAKNGQGTGHSKMHELRSLAQDPFIYVQLAKMWQTENVEKAIEAYQTAIEIDTRNKSTREDTSIEETPRDLSGMKMANNLGALYLTQMNVDEAMQMFEQLLSELKEVDGDEEDILQAVLLYNLARAYEGADEDFKAIEVYRGLLAKHPEHLQAKIRLSSLLHDAGRFGEEDALLKEANITHARDPLLRAHITHYLARNEKWTDVSNFATQTRKASPDDVQALCALGAYHYQLARDSKGSEADRNKDFCRASEAYNRALEVDPTCSVAAQGLAIGIAEDNLSLRKDGQLGAIDNGGQVVRTKSLDVALGIFTRIRDALPDRSVILNMGHCHFFKGDEEKAIELYIAASDKMQGQDTLTLLFLARAYYQLGSKQSDYPAMCKALVHCQKAAHIKPHDRTILYNIAMIQQKSAEIVLGLDPSKRSLQEVEQVIEQAQNATVIFRTLAEAQERPLAYDIDLVDQRSRYGVGLLRRADDQKQRQRTWEGEQADRHADAVRRRQEERRKAEEAEQARRHEEQIRRDEEARVREQQRQEAQAWREQMRSAQEEEERSRAERAEHKEGKKSRKSKKDRQEDGFISEGNAEDEPKPKRRGRKKVADPDDDASEAESRGSRSRSRSKAPKPKKKRAAAVDPDGDDAIMPEKPAKRSKTNFKSKEFIESEEED